MYRTATVILQPPYDLAELVAGFVNILVTTGVSSSNVRQRGGLKMLELSGNDPQFSEVALALAAIRGVQGTHWLTVDNLSKADLNTLCRRLEQVFRGLEISDAVVEPVETGLMVRVHSQSEHLPRAMKVLKAIQHVSYPYAPVEVVSLSLS